MAICGDCSYQEICKPMWKSNDEPTLLAGVTNRIARQLEAHKIDSIGALAKQKIDCEEHVNNRCTSQIKHTWVDTARVYEHARISQKP